MSIVKKKKYQIIYNKPGSSQCMEIFNFKKSLAAAGQEGFFFLRYEQMYHED